MKRILLTICVIFIHTLAFGAVNEMGWTTTIDNNWSQMVSSNHPIYQRAVAQSNACSTGCACVNDYGVGEAVLYQATGDSTYANRVYSTITQSAGTWADRNKTRGSFVEIALAYSLAGNGMSAANKASMEALLDNYVLKVTGESNPSHGTRGWDTDELLGHYFGLVLYALAIREDNVSRSDSLLAYDYSSTDVTLPVGGLTATGTSGTQRNRIYKYFSELAQGGEWAESSMYNLSTLRYVFTAVHAINDFCSGDSYCDGTEFAEITALYDDFSEYYYNHMAPDYTKHFDWGDSQAGYRRTWDKFRCMSLYSAIGYLDNDANIWDIVKNKYDGGCYNSVYFLFYDPNISIARKSGQTDHHATGMNIGLWHEDWTNGSFYVSQMKPRTAVDHETDGFANFNLMRNNKWVINNPKWYYGNPYEDSPYYNHVLMYGAYTGMKEARDEIAFEAGSEYMYHSGVTSGLWASNNQDSQAPVFVDEYTRQLLFVHTDGDNDIVFIHDRIDACKPSSTSCMSAYRLSRLPQRYQDRSTGASAKHHWVIHVDETATDNGGDNYQWTTTDGNEMYLQSYMDSYTAINVDMSAEGSCSPGYYFCGEGGGPVGTNEEFDQLRLAITPSDGFAFYEFLNVLYTDGSATLTELTDTTATESSHGTLVDTGSQWIAAVFKSEEDTTTTFTSTIYGGDTGYKTGYDPNRLTKAKEMSRYQDDGKITFTTTNTDDIDVYILGLNPTKGWTITANGSSAGCIVSDEGVCRFTITGVAQAHTVLWTASPFSCDSTDWRGCEDETSCENVGWYWYNSTCNQNPEDPCATDYTACSTVTTCEGAGYYWCNDACSGTPCEEEPVESVNLTIYANSDTYIQGGTNSTTNYDGQNIYTKTSSSAEYTRVGLLDFNLSSIPTGVDINSVKLAVTVSADGGTSNILRVFTCLRTFVEGEATWEEYSTGNEWGTDGARKDGTDITGNYSTGTNAIAYYNYGGGEVEGDDVEFTSLGGFVTLVQDNIGSNIYLALHSPLVEPNDVRRFRFYDSEYPSATEKPRLIVNYTPEETDTGEPDPESPSQLEYRRIPCGRIFGRWSN